MSSKVVDYGGKTNKYEWTQTKDDVVITAQVPANIKSKDIVAKIERTQISFGVRGQEPIIAGRLNKPIKVADSTWTKDGATVEITLSKEVKKEEDWWSCVVEEDKDKEGGSIDAELIEASKYLDDSLLQKVKAKKLEDKAKSASVSASSEASSSSSSEATQTSV
jgi:hypothetical protein